MGNKVLLLRMVDDLLIQYEHEETAQEIYSLVGPCINFNGVDIEQSNNQMLETYSWNNHKKKLSFFPMHA